MEIPKDHNTRAEAMWRIISQQVDFRKKRVIDLGCGHCEMLWRTYIAGAQQVRGYDINSDIFPIHHETLMVTSETIITAANMNINQWVKEKRPFDGSEGPFDYEIFDIAFCFSVLPYLDDIPATLNWMADNFPLCLIEAQYEPEPYNVGVSTDEEMHSMLLQYFRYVYPLGKTYVKIRSTWRTIWRCEGKAYQTFINALTNEKEEVIMVGV